MRKFALAIIVLILGVLTAWVGWMIHSAEEDDLEDQDEMARRRRSRPPNMPSDEGLSVLH